MGDCVEIRKRKRRWMRVEVLERSDDVLVVRGMYGPLRLVSTGDRDQHGERYRCASGTYWVRPLDRLHWLVPSGAGTPPPPGGIRASLKRYELQRQRPDGDASADSPDADE